MKNFGTMAAAVFVAIVLVLYMCTFQVRFTEVAVVKTWGRTSGTAIDEPGLKFKWPRPIQDVVVFDKRIRTLEDRTEETRTIDGKNLLITTFTLWHIDDPIKFHTNFPDSVEDGIKKLRTTIVTHKHAIVGERTFGEFVSTDPSKRKIREIEQELMTSIAKDAHEEYGIEVVDFGIKKLGLPETVTTDIFRSMKADQDRLASRYVAEGDARAANILADAEATKDRIMAAAEERVSEIIREAQEVVGGYYKEFDRYPELRIFLDKLRTAREALKERTTIIIDAAKESPFDVFDRDVRDRLGKKSDSYGVSVGS